MLTCRLLFPENKQNNQNQCSYWLVVIGWFTQPYANLPLLDGPGPH